MTFGGSTDFSGTLWIYPTASFSDMAPLTAEWNVAHKILLWQRTSGGNKVEFVLRDGADANNIAVTSTVDCSLNNWHLIAYGFDHVSQKIWIQVDNETRVETSYTDTPPTPSTTTDKFTIGNYSGGGGGAINLHYDEAAFWKGRSLSTSDVSLIWNSGTGLFYASW
jgi:hypothetical protein